MSMNLHNLKYASTLSIALNMYQIVRNINRWNQYTTAITITSLSQLPLASAFRHRTLSIEGLSIKLDL